MKNAEAELLSSQSSQSEEGALRSGGWTSGVNRRGPVDEDAQEVPREAREEGDGDVTWGRGFSKQKTWERSMFEREGRFHGDTHQAVENKGRDFENLISGLRR